MMLMVLIINILLPGISPHFFKVELPRVVVNERHLIVFSSLLAIILRNSFDQTAITHNDGQTKEIVVIFIERMSSCLE